MVMYWAFSRVFQLCAGSAEESPWLSDLSRKDVRESSSLSLRLSLIGFSSLVTLALA